jgi:hypothetical protein
MQSSSKNLHKSQIFWKNLLILVKKGTDRKIKSLTIKQLYATVVRECFANWISAHGSRVDLTNGE